MTPALVLLVAMTLAQGTERVEVDPVTCWWRTTATSIRVGEPFTVILTCSLLQTEAARVVADESRLDPAVVQLQPFEMVGGTRADDLTTEGRRFIQYEYRLRAVAENVFASEVALPPLEISYRVESRVSEGNTLAGRDLTYAMPPLTIRVLSLVPDTAGDIREAAVATFAEIERLQSRARLLRTGAIAAVAVGLVLLAIAIGGRVRQRRAAREPSRRTLAPGAVLAAVGRDLVAIQEQARASGWDDDLVAKTLAAARVVAAYATGRPVIQRPISGGPAAPHSGEVLVQRSSETVGISATVTATGDEGLQSVLIPFVEARYGRGAIVPRRLDDALQTLIARANHVMTTAHFRGSLWRRWVR